MSGFIDFLENESTKGSSLTQVPSSRNDKTTVSPKIISKDIVTKKLPKTKSDTLTMKVERRNSVSKVRKSPSKSSQKPPTELDQNRYLIGDKQLRLCIEDVRNPVKVEGTAFTTPTVAIRTTSQHVSNGKKANITKTSQPFSKVVAHSPRIVLKTDDVTSHFKAVETNPKKPILTSPILQPSKLKQNGDAPAMLTGNGNLLALNNYASRPTTATASTVAINQFKKPNGNAAIEVPNFLPKPSIIKTK